MARGGSQAVKGGWQRPTNLTSLHVDLLLNVSFPLTVNAIECVVGNIRHHHFCRTQPMGEPETGLF